MSEESMFGARVSASVVRALELPPLRMPEQDSFGYLQARGVDIKVFERMEYEPGQTAAWVASGIVSYCKGLVARHGSATVEGFIVTCDYGGQAVAVSLP